MTKVTRTKTPGQAWETTVETGGSGDVPGLADVLDVDNSAEGESILNVNVAGATVVNTTQLNADGDGVIRPMHVVVPDGSPPAFIGFTGDVFGVTVNPNSVEAHADDNDDESFVEMHRGQAAVVLDTDGIHMNGLPTSDPAVAGVLWQDTGTGVLMISQG